MILGDENTVDIDVIPTGSLSLDTAMGIGAYPRGRIVEIYGLKHPERQHLLFML